MINKNANNKKKIVGLLGGSFNPAHEGHKYISLFSIEDLGLDEVWWIVTKQNPLKEKNIGDSFDERVQKCKNLVKDFKKIKIVSIEGEIKSTYAIDVLDKIKSENSDTNFIWLMGNDNLENFHKWYRWKEFINSIPIAIFNRQGSVEKELMKTEFYKEFKDKIILDKASFTKSVLNDENKILLMKNEKYKVSSTKIRSKTN